MPTRKPNISLACYRKSQTNLTNLSEKKVSSLTLSQPKKKFFGKISTKDTVKILDFLSYNELKQLGKTSKLFNKLVKKDTILIKFFKNKKYSHNSNSSSVITNTKFDTPKSKMSSLDFSFRTNINSNSRSGSFYSLYSLSSEEDENVIF